ncbi:hypothetical protein KQI84_11185 [bacterium]|nr:hypothetical protein [bacterium]
MSVEIERALNIMKDALLRELGDEVDLIFQYGSQIRGNTHAYSDVDVSFVPKSNDTWHNITVLVDGTLIDLYPIHWSRLEHLANYGHVSCSIIHRSKIVYQRTPEVAARFEALKEKLNDRLKPEARKDTLNQAEEIFQKSCYEYYLLKQLEDTDRRLAIHHHARHIMDDMLHCIGVCNQQVVDTRRLEDVRALSRLPDGFSEIVDRLIQEIEPRQIVAECEELMRATRSFLLAEHAEVHRSKKTMSEVFDSAYPELKADLQHVMLACERGDRFAMRLTSPIYEVLVHMVEAQSDVWHSDFHSLAEYEKDLTTLGFPDLLARLEADGLDGLREACEAFDLRLRDFLQENGADLKEYATLDELEAALATPKTGE